MGMPPAPGGLPSVTRPTKPIAYLIVKKFELKKRSVKCEEVPLSKPLDSVFRPKNDLVS